MKKSSLQSAVTHGSHYIDNWLSKSAALQQWSLSYKISRIDGQDSETPKRVENALSLMNRSLSNSGVFIRALYDPRAEQSLLAPRWIPIGMQKWLVPQQKQRSASIWVSGVSQASYRYSPYLIFKPLKADQVSKIMDRDALKARSAKQYGPGYQPSLAAGMKQFSLDLRRRGRDIEVFGPMFVSSSVNESIISYSSQDVIGVGVHEDPERLHLAELLKQNDFLDQPVDVQQSVKALQLARRLSEVNGVSVPIVMRGRDDCFSEVSLSQETVQAVEALSVRAPATAKLTMLCKLSPLPMALTALMMVS